MDAKNATSTTMPDQEFIMYFPERKKPRFWRDCIIHKKGSPALARAPHTDMTFWLLQGFEFALLHGLFLLFLGLGVVHIAQEAWLNHLPHEVAKTE